MLTEPSAFFAISTFNLSSSAGCSSIFLENSALISMRSFMSRPSVLATVVNLPASSTVALVARANWAAAVCASWNFCTESPRNDTRPVPASAAAPATRPVLRLLPRSRVAASALPALLSSPWSSLIAPSADAEMVTRILSVSMSAPHPLHLRHLVNEHQYVAYPLLADFLRGPAEPLRAPPEEDREVVVVRPWDFPCCPPVSSSMKSNADFNSPSVSVRQPPVGVLLRDAGADQRHPQERLGDGDVLVRVRQLPRRLGASSRRRRGRPAGSRRCWPRCRRS